MTAMTADQLRTQVAALLTATGMPDQHAEATADALLLAEVWGVKSHGLIRLPHYLRRLRADGYNAHATLQATTDLGALVTYAGDGGLGHWQLAEAARVGVERARDHGVSTVAVGDSGHCGALGLFTIPAIQAGMVALVFSNGPATMPAWGASTALLSTSPFAIGIPGADPVIVDMASTAVARGKIAQAARSGGAIPSGWALDAEGEPTTDAQTALTGMLAPLGGAKGYALAMAVESLTGVLVGPNLSADVADMFAIDDDGTRQGIAHLVVTIDAARLDGSGNPGAGARRGEDLAARVRASGGRLPGQIRTQHLTIDPQTRIDIDADTLADLGITPVTQKTA